MNGLVNALEGNKYSEKWLDLIGEKLFLLPK